ncbi:hypothetical protein [Weissella confusa]|uniref:Uncharacterized protein n=1 Tax=Weissella confusa TaxID=1583 RepID=A0A4Z0RWS3_WEICO|nr:hypothetical protein [Weissella confusa]TGE70803.1 hypothetical protein C6P11_10055 [Weissella confusa]
MTDNNQLPQPDNALLQAIQMAFEIPGVKVDRKTFLIAKFNMTTDQVNNGGPQDYFQKEKIDKIAENSINFNVFSSTALSTAADYLEDLPWLQQFQPISLRIWDLV